MFSVHCPEAGAEVLLGPRSIRSMHNTSEGVVSYFRCRCGATGVLVSGRRAVGERAYHPAREAAEAAVPATVGAVAMADCA